VNMFSTVVRANIPGRGFARVQKRSPRKREEEVLGPGLAVGPADEAANAFPVCAFVGGPCWALPES